MPEPKYHSYLIRLWQEDNQTWRFVLLDLIEGQQRGFVDLEELFAFLRDQVDALLPPDSVARRTHTGAALLFGQCKDKEGFDVTKED